jgi:hypothetical protein
MTRITGFKRRQDREADVLSSRFEDDLKFWVKAGSIGTQKTRPEFLDLAITLHTSIVCSRRVYKIWQPDPTEWSFPHRSPQPWHIKDVDTWRSPVRSDKEPNFVCNLSLGLQTQRNVGNRSEALTLVKPTVLVCEVEEASDERDRSKRSRSSSTSQGTGQDSHAPPPKGQGMLSNILFGQPRVTSQTPARSSEKRPSNSQHHTGHGSRPRQSGRGSPRSKTADYGRSLRSQSYFSLGDSHQTLSGTSHTSPTSGSESPSDSQSGNSSSEDNRFEAGEASQDCTPSKHSGQRTSRRSSKILPVVQEQTSYTARVPSPVALPRSYSQR